MEENHDKAKPEDDFRNARVQGSRYTQGALAGNELTTYRYAVVVSRHHVDTPADRIENGVVWRHNQHRGQSRIATKITIDGSSTVPANGSPTLAPARVSSVSTLAQLADIPEEEIWLQKQKSARTRRAYRLDVQHFMRTLAITTPEELRQADHKAVIAWERYMRETEHAASSTIRRRLAALSSLYKHLVRHGHAARNPVGEVERPAIKSRRRIDTRAFESAGAQAARPAGGGYNRRNARPRHPVGRLAGRVAARRDCRAQGRRPAPEPWL